MSLFMETVAYGFTMLVQVFLPCYYGSELTSASEKVSTALFHSDWIGKDKKFRSAMKIVMENCQKPLKLCAWGFVFIDVEMFSAICNTTYTLYAVFKKINLK